MVATDRNILEHALKGFLFALVLISIGGYVSAQSDACERTVSYKYVNGDFSRMALNGPCPNLSGINDYGQIIGSQSGYDPFVLDPDGKNHRIEVDDAFRVIASSINNTGYVAGWYFLNPAPNRERNRTYGFVEGPRGTIRLIRIPGCMNPAVTGINNKMQITGSCNVEENHTRGFIQDADGHVTMLDGPLTLERKSYYGGTNPYAINDQGEVTGSYYAHVQFHAFVYSHGIFSLIESTECKRIEPRGINNAGLVVGGCDDKAFMYDTKTSSFRTFLGPDGASISALAINNKGEIVGNYWAKPKKQGN